MSELYVVATPIGNLEDISQRAISVLKAVDLIAAEDTRHSKKLLQHFGITTPLRSYHEHNEHSERDWLLKRLKEGKRVALISDAGTPLISDPGYPLVNLIRNAGVSVIPVPGACALVAALSVSGLPANRFVFEGFLPTKRAARTERLTQLKHEQRTLIFYESPHRICAFLSDLVEVFNGQREAVIARELTKAYETVRKDTLENLEHWVKADANQQRGELVVLVEGDKDPSDNDQELRKIDRTLGILMPEMPLKQAAKLAAKILQVGKNEVYQRALELKDSSG